MPNICTFDIRVKGKKENVLTLFDWMRAEYRYTNEEFDEKKCFTPLERPECFIQIGTEKVDVDHHIGYRIFDFYYDEDSAKDIKNGEEVCLCGWGNCAWSVYSCMFEGPHTYYSDDKDYPVSLSITLANACRELELEAEIFGCEGGMCFAEHYVFSKDGEILTDEETEYSEIYMEDYRSYEDFAKSAKEYSGFKPTITKEQFDFAKREGECSVVLCKWLKDGEWSFKLS